MSKAEEEKVHGVYAAKKRRVLILASYCEPDEPNCSDRFPCFRCLMMCNIAQVEGTLNVLGGFDYLKDLASKT